MTRWIRAVFIATIAIFAARTLAAASVGTADLSSMAAVRGDLDPRTRTAAVYVTNTGQQAIIGGGIRVAFGYSDGSVKNSDVGFDLLPGAGLEDKVTVTDPAMHVGVLQPGQTYRLVQTAPQAAQGAVVVSAVAEARALVFMDNTAVGDAQSIDDLFERWRDQATTFSAWHTKIAGSPSPAASATALRQLSTDAKAMLARHLGTEPRRRSAAVGSQEEALTRHPEALEYVIDLIDQVRSRIDAHGISSEEGSAWLTEYLRARSETLMAHTHQKGGS